MSIQDMEDLKKQYLDEVKSLINENQIKDYRDEKIDIKINELKENFNGMSIEIYKKKKLQQLEHVANLSTSPSRLFNSFCYDDDDDDDEEYTIAITPVLPTEESDNSLSIRDEHLSTISETESDELIKSSVENLVLIPSESEDFSDIENPHHFNAESDLIEYLLNQDTSIISSPKIDYLLEEFFELNSDAVIESFSPSPIPVEGSDSLMEEIDIFLAPDDSIPPRSGYQQKDRKPSQNDKTEHGMEKTVQNQGQSPKMPKSESILKNQQSNRSRN
ncbi:hypothetical protein Tco_0567581 [Tanacetum coccineum]